MYCSVYIYSVHKSGHKFSFTTTTTIPHSLRCARPTCAYINTWCNFRRVPKIMISLECTYNLLKKKKKEKKIADNIRDKQADLHWITYYRRDPPFSFSLPLSFLLFVYTWIENKKEPTERPTLISQLYQLHLNRS